MQTRAQVAMLAAEAHAKGVAHAAEFGKTANAKTPAEYSALSTNRTQPQAARLNAYLSTCWFDGVYGNPIPEPEDFLTHDLPA